jgi:hypothetical protein
MCGCSSPSWSCAWLWLVCSWSCPWCACACSCRRARGGGRAARGAGAPARWSPSVLVSSRRSMRASSPQRGQAIQAEPPVRSPPLEGQAETWHSVVTGPPQEASEPSGNCLSRNSCASARPFAHSTAFCLPAQSRPLIPLSALPGCPIPNPDQPWHKLAGPRAYDDLDVVPEPVVHPEGFRRQIGVLVRVEALIGPAAA